MAVDLAEFAVRGDVEGQFGTGGAWCYWRKANGWIVSKPAWATEFMRQMRKGWTPLLQYGEYFPEKVMFQGKSWAANRDPYRLILLKGGAKEFPVEQVRSLGWHRKAPWGATFPQLETAEPHQDLICETCRKPYLSLEDLQTHEMVAHRDLSSNKMLARNLSDMTKGTSEPVGKAMELIAQVLAGITERQAATDARVLELLEAVADQRTAPAAPAQQPIQAERTERNGSARR